MLRMRRPIVIWSLCLILVMGLLPIAPAQAQTARDFKEVDTLIARLLDMYDVPGVGLAIVQNDKVLYAKGYGVRNYETKDPVTENTVFSIGSVSKSFTAFDVMQLVDQGKIELDAPIVKYLPDFKLADPEATKTVTVRQFITHTTGLPRADERWLTAVPASRKAVIDDMVNIQLTAKPGTLWQYCNQNFVVAGYLVEKITGQTWEDYTQKNIFDPLGMKSANFNVVDTQKGKDFAEPYLPDVLKGQAAVPWDSESFKAIIPAGPAGSINASVGDLAQWVRLQLGDGTFNGKTLISTKSLQTMHTQQISITGPSSGNSTQSGSFEQNIGYGMAWVTETYRGYTLVQHDGDIDGFTAEVSMVPSEKLGIILLTNANQASVFNEIARLSLTEWMLGLKPEKDLAAEVNKLLKYDPVAYKANVAAARAYKSDPKELEKYVGDYTGDYGNVSVVLKDGMLHVLFSVPVKADRALVQFAPGKFLLNGTLGSVFEITIDDQGTAKVLSEGVVVGQRLGKDVKSAEFKDPKGRFTVTLPIGLSTETKGDLTILKSADPAGTFIIAAMDAVTDDLETSATRLMAQVDSSFALKPVNKRDIPVNGLTWTQLIYQYPDGQILAIEALKQGDTVYFITLQGTTAAVQSLTPKLNTLLLSFKITG